MNVDPVYTYRTVLRETSRDSQSVSQSAQAISGKAEMDDHTTANRLRGHYYKVMNGLRCPSQRRVQFIEPEDASNFWA